MTSWHSDLLVYVHFLFMHQAAGNAGSGPWSLAFSPASPLIGAQVHSSTIYKNKDLKKSRCPQSGK